MKKKVLIIAIGILAAALILWKSAIFSTPHRPNIVFIIVDALRADKLGCYGFPGEISPEIDALAANGVFFENAFSHCSWTRPSIGCMITGLYPRSLGIYKEKYEVLADRYLTLAEVLKSKGYRTVGITANPNINKVYNFQQGFDEYQDSRVIWRWMKPKKGEKKIDRKFDLRKCRDIFEEILGQVALIDPKKGPVYVQAVIMEVHTPWIIRPEYQSLFSDYPVTSSAFNKSPQILERFVRHTLGAVRQVSHDIDEFIRKFRKLPGRENTLFVISSDHGQGLDDHPDVFNSTVHGNMLYKSHLHVPLIVYHPGDKKKTSVKIVRPLRVKERVTLLDLMPTILDYAGIPLPRQRKGIPAVQGKSLLPFITGDNSTPELPGFFVAETHWRDVNKIALYKDNWIYIQNHDGWKGVNRIELQPLGIKENGEKTDRISQEKETAEALRKLLTRWLATHKIMKPEFRRSSLSPKEIQQLKSLGYLN